MYMPTPWGPSQHTKQIIDGIIDVSTAGHGGFGVKEDLAKKHIPHKALQKAIYMGHYYWFEEDCNWAIPFYYNRDWYDKLVETLGKTKEWGENNYNIVINTMQNWHKDLMS